MFQEHIDNPGDPDIGTVRLSGNQTTDAPYDQVDLHPILAGMIQFVYHILVMQSVHL